MAKPSQTFKKRQRENKLREKAQLKRERRQQRQVERKALQAADVRHDDAQSNENQVEATASVELGAAQNE
jgi:hypothetical protein